MRRISRCIYTLLVIPCYCCILLPFLVSLTVAQFQHDEHYDSKLKEVMYTLVKSMVSGKVCYVIAADGWKFEVENPDTVSALG